MSVIKYYFILYFGKSAGLISIFGTALKIKDEVSASSFFGKLANKLNRVAFDYSNSKRLNAKMNEHLFSYGTLQRNDVQLELFGRLLNGAKDILKNYKIASIEIKDELFLAKGEDKFQKTLIPSKDDFIEGTVFEISAEELLLADKYEPDNYRRVKIRLQSGKEAWIYRAI